MLDAGDATQQNWHWRLVHADQAENRSSREQVGARHADPAETATLAIPTDFCALGRLYSDLRRAAAKEFKLFTQHEYGR